MTCKIFHHRFVYLFSVFLLPFVISLFGLVSNSSAVSDFSVTINSSSWPSGWIRPCGAGSSNTFSNSEPCSSYKYGYIFYNNSSSCPSFNFQLTPVNQSTSSNGVDILHFHPLGLNNFALYFGNSISSDSSCSVTYGVSNSNPYQTGSAPSGNIDITENGTYDVTNYVTATVNVPAEVIQGDYHDDLIAINNSILICGAICLVIYFFYCIYRMIIKSAGGWGK